MNKRFVFLCVFSVCVLSGCDQVRGILGMATSGDIEKARKELALKAELEQRQNDSIAAARQTDTLVQTVPEETAGELKKRYYIIIGSFKEEHNTRNLSSFLKGQGYVPRIIPLKNGYNMVALEGYDSYSAARREVETIEQKEVCPYDVWIYDVQQRLHK